MNGAVGQRCVASALLSIWRTFPSPRLWDKNVVGRAVAYDLRIRLVCRRRMSGRLGKIFVKRWSLARDRSVTKKKKNLCVTGTHMSLSIGTKNCDFQYDGRVKRVKQKRNLCRDFGRLLGPSESYDERRKYYKTVDIVIMFFYVRTHTTGLGTRPGPYIYIY